MGSAYQIIANYKKNHNTNLEILSKLTDEISITKESFKNIISGNQIKLKQEFILLNEKIASEIKDLPIDNVSKGFFDNLLKRNNFTEQNKKLNEIQCYWFVNTFQIRCYDF